MSGCDYTKNTLASGEKIQFVGQLNWTARSGVLGKAILLFLIGAVSSWYWHNYWLLMLPLLVVPSALELSAIEMVVTNRRVVYKTGYLSRNPVEARLLSIDEVNLVQSLSQRVINSGDIHVSARGFGERIILRNIDNPKMFKRAVDDAIDAVSIARATQVANN